LETKNSSFRWVVLVFLFLQIGVSVMALYCIPPLFSAIGNEIPLTKAQMGTIMGVVTLAALFFAPLGGALSDKVGGRWAIGIAALVVAVSGAFRTFSGNASELIVWMFLLGAGFNLFYPSVPKVLGTWFPPHELARASGLCFASIGIGSAVALATAVNFMSPTFGGWRGTVIALGVIALALGILWVLVYRDRKTDQITGKKQQNFLMNFKKVIKVRNIKIIFVFYSFCGLGWVAILGLLPVILEERGVPKPGEYVSLMMISTVVFNVLGGMASDKLGKRKPFLMIGAIVQGICIPAFLLFTGIPLAVTLVLYGAALGSIMPIMMIIPVEIDSIGPALAGTAAGAIVMVGNTSGSVGSIVTGKLMDLTESPWPAFVILSAACIVSAMVILLLHETGKKKLRRSEEEKNL